MLSLQNFDFLQQVYPWKLADADIFHIFTGISENEISAGGLLLRI